MNQMRIGFALIAAALVACSSTTEQVEQPVGEDVANARASGESPETTAEVPPQPVPEPKLDLEVSAKKYVTDATEAWSAKDVKKHSALYAPDAVVAIPGPKGWEESKPADMEKGLAGYFAAFPDLKLAYVRVVGNGNVAVAEWVFTGTNTGELMGQKPTNKKVGYRGASVLTFSPDGKVKRESVYFDMGTMMGQLGLGPKGQPVRPVEALPAAPPEFVFAKANDAATDAPVRDWLKTAETGDAKALVALATDDVVISSQYMPADTKGKKALEKETATGSKAFVDQKNNVTNCVAAGDLVACEYTWQATWKGPAMGMKPTGKTGTVHSVEVVKVKDGKVLHATGYANGAEFASTFGLMDDKAGSGAPVKK